MTNKQILNTAKYGSILIFALPFLIYILFPEKWLPLDALSSAIQRDKCIGAATRMASINTVFLVPVFMILAIVFLFSAYKKVIINAWPLYFLSSLSIFFAIDIYMHGMAGVSEILFKVACRGPFWLLGIYSIFASGIGNVGIQLFLKAVQSRTR